MRLRSVIFMFAAAVLSWPAWTGTASAERDPETVLLDTPPSSTGGRWEPWRDAPAEPYWAGTSLQCPAHLRAWRDPARRVAEQIIVWGCEQPNDAAVALWGQLRSTVRVGMPAFEPLPAHPAAWSRAEPLRDGVYTYTVIFARSIYLVRTSAAGLSPDGLPRLATETALAQLRALAGPDHVVHGIEFDGTRMLLTVPFVLYWVILVPIRAARNPLRGETYETPTGRAHWIDVGRTATRLKWGLRLRFTARLFGALSVFGLAGAVVNPPQEVPWAVMVIAVLGVWFGWIRSPGPLRLWRPYRIRGLHLTRRPASWLSPIAGICSLAVGVFAACVVMAVAMVGAFGIDRSPLITDGVLNPRYLNEDLSLPARVAVAIIAPLPAENLQQSVFVIAVLLLVLSVLIRRYGRRRALADAETRLAKDQRAHVLYLRPFDNDVLKIPTSAFGRTSLVERISMAYRQPFEEVLVRHLHTLGPVVAIADPNVRLPDIGAAKQPVPDGTWQKQVREWARRATVIVIVVTPKEVTETGFGWEIDYLARNVPDVPLMLVLAPYRRGELEARWWRFLSFAAVRHRRFAGLDPHAYHGSAAHVIVTGRHGEWIAFGARKRTEFTYAASLARAIETVCPRHQRGLGFVARRMAARLPPPALERVIDLDDQTARAVRAAAEEGARRDAASWAGDRGGGEGDEGVPLDTRALLRALMRVDAIAWERVRQRGPGDITSARAFRDPLEAPELDWCGLRLTASAGRALLTAAALAAEHDMRPVPAGLLALGLVAERDCAAARLLGVHDESSRSHMLTVIQEEILGVELEGAQRL
jgi:hypothetical protein